MEHCLEKIFIFIRERPTKRNEGMEKKFKDKRRKSPRAEKVGFARGRAIFVAES